MIITLENKISELNKLAGELEQFCKVNNLSKDNLFDLNLTLDELVTNIITYGFSADDENLIYISILKNDNKIEIKLEDEGMEFNPLNEKEPEIGVALEDREIGGLGIYFVKKKMNEIHYERANGKNILTMVKVI